jgi:hypothetical protein
MGLTKLIAEPEVRARLQKMIRKPDFGAGQKLLAPPLTKHYTPLKASQIGTAFDYLFRFYLKRLNPQAIERDRWTAEQVGFWFDGVVLHADSGRLEIVPELATSQRGREWALQRERIIAEARENYSLYVKRGTLSDRLLTSAIQLAKLDGIVRSGWPELPDLVDTDKADKDDLQQLVELIPARDFKATDVCLLNPTVGEATRLVGGGDADVIIGDTLIEIKTVMKCRLTREYLNQLAGYYCLYRIAGVDGLPADRPLRRFGVYFSRHGYFFTVPVTECWQARDFEAFLVWFAKLIQNRLDQDASFVSWGSSRNFLLHSLQTT